MQTLIRRLWSATFSPIILIVLVTLVLFVSSAFVYAGRAPVPPNPEGAVIADPSLHNPNLDSGVWYRFDRRYLRAYPSGSWVPGGDTEEDPQDWRLWYLHGMSLIECDPNTEHVHSGTESAKLRPYDDRGPEIDRQIAGLYQVIANTTPCINYRFQMYSWSRQEEPDDTLAALQVGIERSGWHPDTLNDPAVYQWPDTMVWGVAYQYTAGYGPLVVTAEALNTQIAVFTYADADGGSSNKIHWDTGSLEVVPRTDHLIDASQPLPSPSGGIYNIGVDAPTNEASISWDTGAISTYGQVLYRLLGSSTWQYSSLHEWGTVHQIELAGLQYGATYEYVVVSYGYIEGTCKAIVSAISPPRQFETPIPVTSVSISGPTTGFVVDNHTFTASASPAGATTPITYVWEATDHSPVTHSGGLNDTVTLSWSAPGVKTVKVTASNPASVVVDTHTIVITGDEYEPDDDCAQASSISIYGTIQAHTFHTSGDSDWVSFETYLGVTYLIEALTPPDSTADLILEVYDACDGALLAGQAFPYTPDVRLPFTATQTGPLYLHLRNEELAPTGPDASYYLSVRVLNAAANPGAVVLVAGRLYDGDPLQANIHHVTDAAYQLFLNHGYDADRIYYLSTDATNPDVDDSPSKTNLGYAITDWAASRAINRPFTLYMMDHGGSDYFYLDGVTETVSPGEIKAWLGLLENAAPGVKVNVIVDACKSGSFIDGVAQSVSQAGRVVIASTGAQRLAWATQDGALFSDHFVAALERGLGLYSGFREARWSVEAVQPAQTPWLDDDGDGTFDETADGATAVTRGFAYVSAFGEGEWPPYIANVEVGEIVDGRGVITAEVWDDGSVAQVWAAIYPPLYAPPSPDGEEELILETGIPKVALSPVGDDVYSAEYTKFSTLFVGADRVVVYATDDEGRMSRPRSVGGKHYIYLPLIMR
jgi:hypothetical protein